MIQIKTKGLYVVCLVTIMVTITTQTYATLHKVGPSRNYVTVNDLYTASVVADNDTIEIDAATYTGADALAVWSKNNLLIRGVGGRPHLIANGAYIFGKGTWVLAGNDITVDNIEFSGAAVPDENGAGIRLDGTGMTILNCFFHDNENGILTSNPFAGDVTIQYSEFASNGFGDGFTHNLYIGHIDKLVFEFNYSHHTNVGHNLKSRADVNIIRYNRIMDEDSGNSSRLIDLSNGGFALIMGNILMQGLNAINNNAVGYGREGLTNSAPHDFHFINNTIINKRAASCIFVDVEPGTDFSHIANNIFGGTGTTVRGSVNLMTTNVVETDIAELHLIDESMYDYRLTATSPGIDFGTTLIPTNNYARTPAFSYEHIVQAVDRLIVNNLDVGAYEYDTGVAVPHITTSTSSITIGPNPYTDVIVVEGIFQPYEIKVLDAMGTEVYNYTGSASPLTIQLNTLSAGLYFIAIRHLSTPTLEVRQIIKM